ncbi:flagellar biosynthetic protein FliO [Treponema sp. R80B11-R83G3]
MGLLVQIPVFSQEVIQESVQEADQQSAQETDQEAPVTVDDPYRAAERNIIFGSEPAIPAQRSGSSIWIVIRMILVLALAAAAIYGIVFFIKRTSKQTAANDPFLKILASSHLGFNRYVHIASVGSKVWLLGASEGGVNLISEIEDKEIIDAMLLEDSKKSAQPQNRFPDFLSMLRSLGTPFQTRSSGIDEIRKRRERLKGM